MKLIPNLRSKTRAYSFQALLSSLVLFLLPEFVLAYTGHHMTSPYVVGGLALFLGVFGLVGWGVDQSTPDLKRTAKVFGLSGVVAALVHMALVAPSYAMGQKPVPDSAPVSAAVTYEQTAVELVPLVKRWEGKHACKDNANLHCSYLDRIAAPPRWTVCYGHTETARAGQRFSEEGCVSLLRADLRSYWDGVRKGFTPQTIAQRLTAKRDAAFTDLGYNAGVGAVRGSTATRRLNAGDIIGACAALTWYNKAGGRIVRGLVNRRAVDQAMCLAGAT